ncbi:uncharacterized protein MONOS_10697 [Monocercomonoides exilis]|uniref:uncharacterized protein n=1 Tax=Monocercomonoides exilis TaxID=2049356 RepID=UPI0035598A18|nr:hypothetical protein MONOS_10697 [Monocercomonoides exilis]|eukprot:MONOS_10697.1-p1 / transcript=MONOS_10697.1 / gene=MONOS_10697 / organism=Monocercomonoides_exilis_PA203 / gene_product=unspecified product / transcript_product=unspecified product / location=Mono_scaffold00496:29210-30312(+) / protein_length=242 / sequence_SO=supercontig / SO=protein_coding / is_pseudo=false
MIPLMDSGGEKFRCEKGKTIEECSSGATTFQMETLSALNRSLDIIKLYESNKSDSEKMEKFLKIVEELIAKVKQIMTNADTMLRGTIGGQAAELASFVQMLSSNNYLELEIKSGILALFLKQEEVKWSSMKESFSQREPLTEEIEFGLTFLEFRKQFFQSALSLMDSASALLAKSSDAIAQLLDKKPAEEKEDETMMGFYTMVMGMVKAMEDVIVESKTEISEMLKDSVQELEQIKELLPN